MLISREGGVSRRRRCTGWSAQTPIRTFSRPDAPPHPWAGDRVVSPVRKFPESEESIVVPRPTTWFPGGGHVDAREQWQTRSTNGNGSRSPALLTDFACGLTAHKSWGGVLPQGRRVAGGCCSDAEKHRWPPVLAGSIDRSALDQTGKNTPDGGQRCAAWPAGEVVAACRFFRAGI